MTLGYKYLNAYLKMHSPILWPYSVSFKRWMKLYYIILRHIWNYIYLKHWNSLKIDKQIVNNLLYWGKIKFCAKAVKGLSIDYQKKKKRGFCQIWTTFLQWHHITDVVWIFLQFLHLKSTIFYKILVLSSEVWKQSDLQIMSNFRIYFYFKLSFLTSL